MMTNDGEKLKDIASIIDPNWPRKLHPIALLTILEAALADAQFQAIIAEYFCNKCMLLIEGRTKLYDHVAKKHKELMIERDVGQVREETAKKSIVKKIVDAPLGDRLCTAVSGYNGADFAEELLQSQPTSIAAAHREEPFDLSGLPSFRHALFMTTPSHTVI